MILKRRVALNGVELDEVDERIVISSVEPADGIEEISPANSAAGFGQRITGYRRNSVDIVVVFRILQRGHSVDGQQARSEVLEAVNAWAAAAAPERGGAYLTVNYKPERRLHVVLAQAPGEGSLWDWSKDFTITFRAYAVPYWEDEAVSSARIGTDNTSGSGSIQLDGSARTTVDAELLNRSGMSISTATITIGGKAMQFNAMGLAANETLVIDHAGGLLRIRIRSAAGAYRSAMDKRAAASADDFTVTPGAVSVSFSCQRACRLTVNWRCRYL